MTREEAERVAEGLVTVEDGSWQDGDGIRVAFDVSIAGTVIQYNTDADRPDEAEERATAWREAIVRALMGVG